MCIRRSPRSWMHVPHAVRGTGFWGKRGGGGLLNDGTHLPAAMPLLSTEHTQVCFRGVPCTVADAIAVPGPCVGSFLDGYATKLW